MKKNSIFLFTANLFLASCTASLGPGPDPDAPGSSKDTVASASSPTEVKKTGPMKVIIARGTRTYLRKNTKDTIQLAAHDIPLDQKIVAVTNATIMQFAPDNYIIKPSDKADAVTIILKQNKKPGDLSFKFAIPVDSVTIDVK